MYKCWTITKNKNLEFQMDRFEGSWFHFFVFSVSTHSFHVCLLGLSLDIRWMSDHSGVSLDFCSPFGYYVGLNLYDGRHWEERQDTPCKG
jgi:hypothetical protein